MYIPSLKQSTKKETINRVFVGLFMVIGFLLMSSFDVLANDKQRIKPIKQEKSIVTKNNEVIVVTKTVFTKSDWNKLKELRRENRKKLRKLKKELN